MDAICTVSMDDLMGNPVDFSVTPSLSSASLCPDSVAPPWLPMAGTIKGAPPASRTISPVARSSSGRRSIPLLPAVMATSDPAFSLRTSPESLMVDRTAAEISFMDRLLKTCLTG